MLSERSLVFIPLLLFPNTLAHPQKEPTFPSGQRYNDADIAGWQNLTSNRKWEQIKSDDLEKLLNATTMGNRGFNNDTSSPPEPAVGKNAVEPMSKGNSSNSNPLPRLRLKTRQETGSEMNGSGRGNGTNRPSPYEGVPMPFLRLESFTYTNGYPDSNFSIGDSDSTIASARCSHLDQGLPASNATYYPVDRTIVFSCDPPTYSWSFDAWNSSLDFALKIRHSVLAEGLNYPGRSKEAVIDFRVEEGHNGPLPNLPLSQSASYIFGPPDSGDPVLQTGSLGGENQPFLPIHSTTPSPVQPIRRQQQTQPPAPAETDISISFNQQSLTLLEFTYVNSYPASTFRFGDDGSTVQSAQCSGLPQGIPPSNTTGVYNPHPPTTFQSCEPATYSWGISFWQPLQDYAITLRHAIKANDTAPVQYKQSTIGFHPQAGFNGSALTPVQHFADLISAPEGTVGDLVDPSL